MLSILLALVMAVSMMTVMFTTPASASDTTEADKALAATRYRYPILRFENPKFPTGVAIDENMSTSSFLSNDKDANGTDSMDLFFARVDEYDMFNMKLGKNRALRITSSDKTSNVVTAEFTGYVIHTGEEVGTSTQILPNDIQGIPEDATDHGVMLHIEVTGLPGKEADGFTHAKFDAETLEITGYSNHVAKEFNVTFQEWDYRENGKVVKKAGEEQATAMNVKAGGEITLVWTKDVSYTNTTNEVELLREENGLAIKDEEGNYQYVPVEDYSYKAGDVMKWKTYEYEYDGRKKDGGTVNLPRDFCGYVIIPFASFQRCWNADNVDGHLNFKYLCLANLYLSHYWYHQGDVIIDEYCFYGPTFAKANGAYDYGDIKFSNHKDSLVNRKEIKIEYVEEESSLAPPPDVIETAVTLKNNGVTLNAPATAGLKADTKFHADVVDPNATEYSTAVYSKLFGDDANAYKSYSVYLGDDGEIEPTDYCELILPIPDGMNAADAKVYVIEGSDLPSSEKKAVDFKLSDDKKSVILKVVEMRAYIIADSKAGGSTEEPGSSAEDGSTSTEDGSTTETSTGSDDTSTGTTDTSTGTTDDDKDDDKTSAGTTDTDNEKGSSAWIWIVVGAVVLVGAAAAVIVLTRKKPAVEDGEEEAAEDQPEA